MAVTSYSVNAAEAVKLWSRKLFRESLKNTDVARFIGMDSNSLIHVQDDMKKGPGDRVTIILRMQLSGQGVIEGETQEGNEERLTTYTDNIVVNQLRHAVRSASRISDQRIPFSVREEARMGLTDWWKDRFAISFFNQVTGNLAETNIRYTGMQGAITADTAHSYLAGTGFTSGANMMTLLSDTASDKMNLTIIDNIIAQAKTLSPVIRPVSIPKIGNRFVMFLHPFQVKDLRTTTGTGTWQDIQKAALMGGQISNNPIYTGALAEYNGVIMHEDPRVPLGADLSGTAVANTRMAVLCGAQSVGLAFGQGYDVSGETMRMTWVEELFDFEDQYGVAAGMIWGLKKFAFNSLDFSTIRVATYASAPT